MAVLTLRAVAAGVCVVRRMATEASIRGSLVALVDVAACARELSVLAGQRVSGCRIVIETHIEPASLGVAIDARSSKIAAVPIVGEVARAALGLGRMERGLVLGVTAFASELGVLAAERKAGDVMVETIAIETEDVGITSFVLGMAAGARGPDQLG